MKKRLLSLCLSGLLAFSSIAVGTSTVQAEEIVATTYQVQLPMPQESDYVDLPTTRNVGTKIVKQAIKFIVKHADDAAKIVEKVAGKTVAKNFLKYFDKIVAALNPLLEWTDVPSQAVYDAVYRALYNAGASSSVASTVALAIKEGLSWFI